MIVNDDTEAVQTDSPKDYYTFEERFTFDGLNITVGSGYTLAIVDNEFSEYDGAQVLKLPVTVENTTDETKGLNMFYYTAYGPSGTKAEMMDCYFDESLYEAGELRPGASYTKYMYFLCDVPGAYAI